MIGAFNRSVSYAKRRSQPFVPRFEDKYSELQTESEFCPWLIVTYHKNEIIAFATCGF